MFDLPIAQSVKNCLQCRRAGFEPWVGKIPWRRAWEPTLAFFPGKYPGPRSLVGYSPWCCKESDLTERLSHTCKAYTQRLKHLPAMLETWVRSLGREDSLEKEMATHPSILAWRTPWTEEPGGLQSIGLQRVGHDGRDVACARTHMHTHAHIPPLSAGPSFSLLFSTYIYLSFLRASPSHSRPWH